MRVSTVTAILTSFVVMAWMMSIHWRTPPLYADGLDHQPATANAASTPPPSSATAEAPRGS